MSLQPDECGTRHFFRWSEHRAIRNSDTLGISRNISGLVGIPLKRAPLAPGDKPSPSKELEPGGWPSEA